MKNVLKTLALLLFIATSYSLSAQIAIGPKAGINLATIGGDDAPDDVKSIVGFQFGAAAEISVNEMISVQPELLYFQKGAKAEGSEEIYGTTIEYTSTQMLNYFEIPLLLKLKFGAEDGPRFFATVGPSFGFGLGGKWETETTVNGETEKDDGDIDFEDDKIKKLDLGASIGAGAEFAAGPGNFFVDVRYLLGLTTTDDSDFDQDVKHRGIGISVGYLIPIVQ